MVSSWWRGLIISLKCVWDTQYTIHISLSVVMMRHNVILIYPQDHVCGLAEANQPGLDCLSNEQVIDQIFSSVIWISMHFLAIKLSLERTGNSVASFDGLGHPT